MTGKPKRCILTTSMLTENFNLSNYLKKALSNLEERESKILVKRFGLESEAPLTLAELGKQNDVTRERIRQIANSSLEVLRAETAKQSDTEAIREFLKNYFEGIGHIRRHDLLVRDFGNLWRTDFETPIFANKLVFLFTILERPMFVEENDHLHPFWYYEESAYKKALALVKTIIDEAGDRKKELIEERRFLEFLREIIEPHKINEPVAMNYLTVSKNFGMNPYGDFGLTHWIEIVPKTVRDKAYLVLRKETKPLHFIDIAKKVNSLGIDRKQADHRTVHNELIKDGRFVLVGRGTYGLKEHGFTPGTAREVIARLLKQKGPMTQAAVVEGVTTERPFKKNTVILNLQSKKHFKKLPDGRYTVA